MAITATKTIFQNIGTQLESYLSDEIDEAVRFDGDPASAIESRLRSPASANGCVVYYGFDRREPTILAGDGREIHTEMPVEFIVVVESMDRDGYQSDIEYLDDVMDKLSDEALNSTNFSWWSNGIGAMADGPVRGINLSGAKAVARGIRKTIKRKKT